MVTHRTTADDGASFLAPDVLGLARELHVQLQRYIEAQYPIRQPDVVAERYALLETSGVISQEPCIESTPGYAPGPSDRDLALPSLVTAAVTELVALPWSIPPQL